MKVRRILTLGGAVLLGIIVLAMDVIRTTVDIELTGFSVIRNILVCSSFILLYLFLEISDQTRIENAVRKLGLILVSAVIVAGVMALIYLLGEQANFEAKEGVLRPLGFRTVFVSAFVSLSFSVLSILVFRFLRDLILYKRRKGTRRNLLILVGLMIATALSTFGLDPLDSSVFTGILFGLSVAAMLMNSFRLSWIVYLSKREKIFTLIFAFLLFGTLTILNVMIQSGSVNQIFLYYSYPLKEFVGLTLLFGNIYAGMTFVSTLFHLPTAEAFERKTTEVTSLHTLGKLVTQVFDFDDLVDTVTTMTLQVCEAQSCWLEIVHRGEESARSSGSEDRVYLHTSGDRRFRVRVVGLKNITADEIEQMLPFGEHTLRDVLFEERKPIVVDNLATDKRVGKSGKKGARHGSLVVVPLLSHTDLTGILYALKESEHGFFRDDVEVVSAFADQVTIAIENSRLIDQSLERERLMREMLLAQEMQKRLLPQRLPSLSMLEVDAVSRPAFEVGGDYYDVVSLDEGRRLGIVVGDVSGKGVSAAFYMSEVKGIFQSLSRIHASPRDLLRKANEVLAGSIDRRSFISLIYAVLDTSSGELTLSRAGHCPMLLVGADRVHYVRPSGMGLGLSAGATFSESIEEERVRLEPGDVCVFYTDGLTEARNGEDEFGYERLIACAKDLRSRSAAGIKDAILEHVQSFTQNQTLHDDLTLVVLKWNG